MSALCCVGVTIACRRGPATGGCKGEEWMRFRLRKPCDTLLSHATAVGLMPGLVSARFGCGSGHDASSRSRHVFVKKEDGFTDT